MLYVFIKGQLDALKGTPSEAIIQHMQEQEQAHLETFNKFLIKKRVRPTILSPVWHAAGYALGYVTGKMGEKAAMACTVAIEDVINEHYAAQEKSLELIHDEKKFKKIIKKIRKEELEHRDIALDHGAKQTPGYEILSGTIKTASKIAIWLSKKI